jgi:conjugal transfer pilus assembly protein TraU
MPMKKIINGLLIAATLMIPQANSESLDFQDFDCPNSEMFANLISDFCWSCMFPIYIGGVKIWGDSSNHPDDAADDTICECSGDILEGQIPQIGTPIGFYFPEMLMEISAKPYCFPALQGTELGQYNSEVSKYDQGNEAQTTEAGSKDSQQASFSWHQYSFPLLDALELFQAPGCSYKKTGFMSPAWMSEALATWYDPEVALYASPEALLFTTPLALVAMVMDCTVSTADEPMDTAFYTAGCWGKMYPLTQDSGDASDRVRNKSLAATKALYFLARLGQIDRTMGNDALCSPQDMLTLKKSMFKMQQLWPLPEAAGTSQFCQNESACSTGSSTSTLP